MDLRFSSIAASAGWSQCAKALSPSLTPRRSPNSQCRSFFSLPPNPFSEPKLIQHSERRVMRFSPDQIYTVVADINSYEAFVPWCSSSRILTSETVGVHKGNENRAVATHRMTAELGVGFKAFNERYVSEVLCLPNQRVQAIASNSSLFKVLKTTWTLSPHQVPQSLAAPNSIHTNVDFHISFQFRSPIYANLSALFLEEVSQTMVGAFERRAHAIYGRSH